jgi:hypothetical protein
MEGVTRDVASLVLAELTFVECLKMRAVNRHWNNLVVRAPKVWAVKGTTGENFLRGLWRVKAKAAREQLRKRKPQEHIRRRKKKVKKLEEELKSFELLKVASKKNVGKIRRGVLQNIELWKRKIHAVNGEIKELQTEETYYRNQNIDADKMSFIF